MDVNEVLLPGVGLRYEFTNADGDRIGVIARREGGFELVSYPPEDPDEGRPLFRLTREEADAVAEILGAPRIVERFADLSREVPGLVSDRIDVPAGSPHAGLPMGAMRARTRTGVSVVAIVRGEDVIAAPMPAEVIHPDDVLVVMGTAEGIEAVRRIVEG